MCSRWAQSLWTDKRRMFMIQRACTSTGESGGLPFTNMTCWRPVIFGIISLFFALWSSYVINTCNVTRCLIITHKFPPFHAFIPGKCKSGLAAGKNLIQWRRWLKALNHSFYIQSVDEMCNVHGGCSYGQHDRGTAVKSDISLKHNFSDF